MSEKENKVIDLRSAIAALSQYDDELITPMSRLIRSPNCPASTATSAPTAPSNARPASARR